MGRDEALTGTQALRFGLGELLNGTMAGMFDGESNIEPASSPAGFVVDVSGCGTDDRVLRFAMLAGQRAVSQMLALSTRPTLRINDEGWRIASTLEGVRYMQHDFKLGRVDALSNILVVHRFAEIGAQADGAVGEIANRLVSDADLHVMFRQGDTDDAADSVDAAAAADVDARRARTAPGAPLPDPSPRPAGTARSGPVAADARISPTPTRPFGATSSSRAKNAA